MKTIFFSMLMLGTTFAVCAQQKQDDPRIPNKKDLVTYRLSKNPSIKTEWIDFNKNGKKDIYEDPNALVEDRIEDLLSQMTVEEKTCQMVTLYGYKRVLDDELLLPNGRINCGRMVWEPLTSISMGFASGDYHLQTMRLSGRHQDMPGP